MKSFKSLLAQDVEDNLIEQDSALLLLQIVQPKEFHWLKNDYESRFEPWECSFSHYLSEVVLKEYFLEKLLLADLNGVKYHSQVQLSRSSENAS